MAKTYIVFNDGSVGYIDTICNCGQCKQRGTAEVFINDMDGNYLDCIKANELNNAIYFGNSISEALSELTRHYKVLIETKEKEKKYLQEVINYYCEQLLKDYDARREKIKL